MATGEGASGTGAAQGAGVLSGELRIEGEVSTPRTFDSEALAALPGQVADVSSVAAGRTGVAVALASILDAVAPTEGAGWITLESDDGDFSASVQRSELGGAIVIHAAPDGPLPRELGGPYRFLIPDAAACKTGGADRCATVKFLGRITVSAAPGRDTRKVT
ncbi:MAG: hypothetical protein CMJ83_19385 [Planctomycetes bacterium]|nr:hypothetical protein [Planctomycetota bacterium]